MSIPAPGSRIAHYDIVEELGRGGMGVVFKARDTKLNRIVALKFLPYELTRDEESTARFVREAQAAAAIDHPNICAVHEISETEDGQTFIVMGYYGGETLRERLDSRLRGNDVDMKDPARGHPGPGAAPDGAMPRRDPHPGSSVESHAGSTREGIGRSEKDLDSGPTSPGDQSSRSLSSSYAGKADGHAFHRKDGGLHPGEAIQIALQVASGLSAAHKAGIVHRDIKPGNIILADDGRVRILDFGLAKLASGIDITKEGSTSGTAAYMSPEQINGMDVDQRTDLWSLGVVLHEMLAGKRPFHGEYDQAVSYAIVNKEAESIRKVAPDIPEVLAAVVEKALKKDPAERFQSADEFIEALAPLTTPAAVPGSFVDFVKRPIVAVPLVVVVLVLGLVGWKVYSDAMKMRWARQVALPEIIRLADERERAEAFRVMMDALPYLEGDPSLEGVRNYISGRAWFETDPPGADVSWKRYREPDDRWVSVGATPIDSVLFPREVVRARIRKEGYDTVNRLVSPGRTEVKLYQEGTSPEGMVVVPGGKPSLYVAGIDHNPAQQFETFLYDRYEVTNREYKQFVDAGGYEDSAHWSELPIPFADAMARFTDRSGRRGPATWEAGSYPSGEEDYPVAGVSWYEAMAYARWAGKALPTVYHWNGAAWTSASYVFLAGTNMVGEGLKPVGSNNSMTRYDQYDLAGNVREWVYNIGRNGQRFILGGGWNDPSYAFNDAYSQDPFDRSVTNGFRTIKYLGEEPNLEALQADIDQPYRDYRKEEPVSGAEFEAIRRTYDYDRTPLNAKTESVDDSNPVYSHETITFDAAYGGEGERVVAHLYLPKSGSPPYQTIVFFPGSNGIHDRDYSQGADFVIPFVDFLMRDGRAFLFPIYKSTYERGDELTNDYPEKTVLYKDHVNMWVKDLRRSVDYLETRSDIDAANLAYFGWSWGALLGPIMTALEPRFKVQILLVAGLAFQPALPEADPFNFLPHVTAATLMLNGRYDHYFPVETSQKPFYDYLGVPEDQKRMVVSDLGHTVTREQVMRETFAWLDRWLDHRNHR